MFIRLFRLFCYNFDVIMWPSCLINLGHECVCIVDETVRKHCEVTFAICRSSLAPRYIYKQTWVFIVSFLVLGVEGNAIFAAQAWRENLYSALSSVYWEPTKRHHWTRIQEIVCKVWGAQRDFHQSKQRFWIHQTGETYNSFNVSVK